MIKSYNFIFRKLYFILALYDWNNYHTITYPVVVVFTYTVFND